MEFRGNKILGQGNPLKMKAKTYVLNFYYSIYQLLAFTNTLM